ncbi:MAG: AMP-binding protein [Alphaproteobacteria bacterium]
MLSLAARRGPDREAIVAGARRVTFAELESRANRLGNALLGLGLAQGDRVALYMPNSIALVEAMAGVLKAGGIILPISTRLAGPEIRFMLEDAEPFALIYTETLREAARHATAGMADVRLMVAGDAETGECALDTLIVAAADTLPKRAETGNDDAVLCYTSGTTGRPKGAISTQRNLVVNQGWMNAVEWRLTPADRTLVATPMAHRTGVARIASSFCLGSALVLQERFDPEEAVKLIAEERVSHIGVVPTIARLLLPAIERAPEACATLRTMLATGEAFPVELKQRLFAALPELGLHSFFSQTEGGTISNLRPEEQVERPDSCGLPFQGVEVRLVDAALDDVAPGEPGEVLVRCGEPGEISVMREYFRRPEENRAAFVDGWLRTGDVARRGEGGYLYFVDRLKDMIVSGGLNIYSREVEDALMTHPGVLDAAVIGVPDAKFGEAVMAFIKTSEHQTLSEETLIEHCRQRIASYKKPRHVRFVDEMPRNSTGKIAKHRLRDQAG